MSLQERPLRADAERNRRRLLDAARTLFATRGLEVSMDDIAREAGVGVGTAYRRFRSREEIVDALFEERLGEMEARAKEAAANPDAWDALLSFFLKSLKAQAEDRGFKELVHSSAMGREKVARMRERVMPIMDRVITRAKEEGQLREDVELADFTVISFMIGAAVDFAGAIDEGAWERYATLLFDGLRPGSATQLPRAAMTMEQIESAMECWRPARR